MNEHSTQALIRRDVSLRDHTTLKLSARARWFAEVTDAGDLQELLHEPPGTQPPLVLGDGSNCLFTQDYDGLVLHMGLTGIRWIEDGDSTVLLEVAAGENWHRFLRWTLEQGLCGLENLALIPGTVGAAPIQNIGAYGVEVERCIESVEAFDRNTGRTVTLSREDCDFAYRDSRFKREAGRYIVLAVVFRLWRNFEAVLDYAGLRERLESRGITHPTATDVADAVESLRREKLPDPEEIGNAGSFFKNPVVPASTAEELQSRYPGMPRFPAGDGVKLSAGWLIERAGMKGYREGDAGISERHALVLVNHGNASGEALWRVATAVRQAVEEQFGIALEAEPRVY